MQILNFGRVPGLTKEEQQQLSDLAAAYNYHQSRNAAKDKYYEGHITLNDVNLGIALPQGLRNLEAAAGGRKPWTCWRHAPCSTALWAAAAVWTVLPSW